MLEVLIDDIAGRAKTSPVVIIGIAGAVAVGKSTIARELANALGATVVSTDVFLRTNADLAAADLTMRKGFPESYDHDAMRQALSTLREGEEVRLKVYSHDTYDFIDGAEQEVSGRGVVLVEGIMALQDPVVTFLDVAVYVDAPEPAVRGWFVERFHGFVDAGRDDPMSFYNGFAGFDRDQVTAVAEATWDGINAVNLRDHIDPSRRDAHYVIEKDADHAIKAVTKSPSD